MLETWAKDNADLSTGIILYGSYLPNGFGGNGDTNVFPVPVLTAMGSLDGGALSYVTREARESSNPGNRAKGYYIYTKRSNFLSFYTARLPYVSDLP